MINDAGDVTVANGASLPIIGVGTIIIHQEGRQPIHISEVYHVPGMACGLISTGRLTDSGSPFSISIASGIATISAHGHTVLTATSIANVYPIIGVTQANDAVTQPALACAAAPTQRDDLERLWHHRLGHVSPYALPQITHTTQGLPPLSRAPSLDPCKGCLLGKRARDPFPPNEATATSPLELVHVDIGYSDVHGIDGSKYFIVFVDDWSRRIWMYCLANQTTQLLLTTFQRFVSEAQSQAGCYTVRRIHGDNQFDIKALHRWCNENQIALSFTVPYSPQMNGRAERVMRTIKEPARTMLIAADLPPEFWPYSLHTAVYIRNRVPHRSLNGQTPYQKWFGRPPDLGHLRTFGCLAWPMLQYDQRENGPWAHQSVQGIMVGYGTHDGVYLIYLPDSKRVITSREVQFDEAAIWRWPPPAQTMVAAAVLPDSDTFIGDLDVAEAMSYLEGEPFGSDEAVRFAMAAPQRFAIAIHHFGLHVTSNHDLKGYCSVDGKPVPLKKLAMSPEWPQWVEAAKREVSSLDSMQTFTPVSTLPEGKRAFGLKWVLTRKTDIEGNLVGFKARLVFQGHTMREGIEYNVVWSPVIGIAVLRQLLAMAVRFNMIILMFDVITAYLNAKTTVEVYVRCPELYSDLSDQPQAAFYRVERSLYGMKASGREWFHTLRDKLLELGFKQSPHEPCLFVHKRATIGTYVDDIMAILKNQEDADWLTEVLMNAFKMRKSPASSAFVGLTLQKSTTGYKIHQKAYIRDYLDSNDFTARGRGNPMDPTSGGRLRRYSGICTPLDKAMYLSRIGRTLWIATISRPDISYAVGKLSRYSSNPGPDHALAVETMSLYLKRTAEHGLYYELPALKDSPQLRITVYSDSDHAGCLDTRRSTSGYIVLIDNMPVFWRSKMQSFAAESSTAAEYVAIATAATEALVIRDTLAWMWTEAGFPNRVSSEVILYCDSAGAVANASEESSANRTRTVDIKYHMIKDYVHQRRLKIQRVEGNSNPADALTKPLSSEQISSFCTTMGVRP